MPGLLDGRGGFDDSLTMGLLGASQALLTHPSQGGGLGAAFAAFPAAQQAMEQRRMRELLMQAQMENHQAEMEYRKAQMEASRQKAQHDAMLESGRNSVWEQIAQQNVPTFRDASAEITGVKPTADYVAPQNRKLSLTPELAAQAAKFGIKPEDLQKVFDAGRQEVARTIEGVSADGMPQTLQYDKFGRPVGQGVNKPFEYRNVNLGNKAVSVNPYQPYSLDMGATPDAVLSNALGRDRLALDVSRGKRHYDSERGVLVDPDTSTATPVTMNGQPIGGKPKEPTEGQANAFLFANRAKQANDIVTALGDKPSIIGAGITSGAGNMPMVGGAVGGLANLAQSPETQQYLQAQRDFINAVLRKESGAVIGKDEFDNARKQYFPQTGDSEAVIRQKAANRATAIEGLTAGAGPLAQKVGAGAPPAPRTNATQNSKEPVSWASVLLTARQSNKSIQQTIEAFESNGFAIQYPRP